MITRKLTPDEARNIWSMSEQAEYTDDVEAQYKRLLNYLDIMCYRNGNSFDAPIITRHAIAYLAMAMPSLAFIDPSRTREISYNLNVACKYINCQKLMDVHDLFHSDNMHLVEKSLVCAFYKLVAGRKLYDEEFHEYVEELYKRVSDNKNRRNLCAIDTIKGKFEVLPNAMCMMAFELHDRFFATKYRGINADILAFIHEHLQDEKTGLYYGCLSTGIMGHVNETYKKAYSWCTSVLDAKTNGMALAFMHYLEPENTEKAWNNYKEYFTEALLSVMKEELCDVVGASYVTQLGDSGEAIFGALLAAREMGDVDFFNQIQDRVIELGEPRLAEGKVFFDAFGVNQHMFDMFLLFTRTHIEWSKLFGYSWEEHYNQDYNKVR